MTDKKSYLLGCWHAKTSSIDLAIFSSSRTNIQPLQHSFATMSSPSQKAQSPAPEATSPKGKEKSPTPAPASPGAGDIPLLAGTHWGQQVRSVLHLLFGFHEVVCDAREPRGLAPVHVRGVRKWPGSVCVRLMRAQRPYIPAILHKRWCLSLGPTTPSSFPLS